MNDELKKVSVVGLDRLGFPLATCFAAKGYDVIGVDSNLETVKTVNLGQAPVHEPGIDDLLATNKSSLKAVTDYVPLGVGPISNG